MNIGELKNIGEIKLPMFYRNILEAWIKAGGGSSSLPKSLLTIRNQGPFVKSIVSLTSSLRGQLVKCFTTL